MSQEELTHPTVLLSKEKEHKMPLKESINDLITMELNADQRRRIMIKYVFYTARKNV